MDWALVTGACSGIGLELARGLAKRGHPLVLVSNREKELAEAAASLRAAHGVEVHAVVMDLARAEAGPELYAEAKARGVEVGVLVNNAGILHFGEVAEMPGAKVNAMLQLHAVTPTMLARLFGAEMRERRRGQILIVSSISAFRPYPGIAIYSASKRYLFDFADALRHELLPWGVNVTCLAPGAVATGLYDSRVDVNLAKKTGVMVEAAFVADRALTGLFEGRALVVPGFGAKLLGLLMQLAPGWVVGVLRRRTGLLPMPPPG
ncbi:MAG: SDR family NAD(P)-dependent oxidoreductase [Archangium sp.]|nr:SDR family NAD(P)-dependent oxidoreductase [Archangium sp.]